MYITECYHHILFSHSSKNIWLPNFFLHHLKIFFMRIMYVVGCWCVLVTMCRMRYFSRILIWCFCGALQRALLAIIWEKRNYLTESPPNETNVCNFGLCRLHPHSRRRNARQTIKRILILSSWGQTMTFETKLVSFFI